MTIGTSILLIAVGAIMRFAVTVHSSGFNIHTAGTILMIVGIVGLVLSLLWATTWSRRRAVAPEPVARERDAL